MSNRDRQIDGAGENARDGARGVRWLGLDALRGLAILLMCLSGMIPKTLPNWMDHGYQPHYRPNAEGVWQRTFDPAKDEDPKFDGRWKAYTWVDWVFPGFLFAMGAAIPLAMRPRIDAREKWHRLIGGVFLRWLSLIAFAYFVHQFSYHALRGEPLLRQMLSLVGFALCFALYVRLPRNTTASLARWIRLGSLATILCLIVAINSLPGQTFKWDERDIIILLLAHGYLVASLAWLVTRDWPWVRFAMLAPVLLLAHYVAISPSQYPEWLWLGKDLWTAVDNVVKQPLIWLNVPKWINASSPFATEAWKPLLDFTPLWNFSWYKFLWCIIPGTMAGDWALRWARSGSSSGLTNLRSVATIVLPVLIAAGTFAGLQHYGYPVIGVGGPLATPYLAVVLTLPLVVGYLVAVWPSSQTGAAHFTLSIVGASFLLIGIALAVLRVPAADGSGNWVFFEGGISKGPPATLSYYFTAVGNSMLLLVALTELIDIRGFRKSTGLLIANGQNPLLAYYLSHGTVAAVLALAIFSPWAASMPDIKGGKAISIELLFGSHYFNPNEQPWIGFLWGAIKTLLIAAIVWMCTKLRLIWRA
jgi:predicted acyltransferase